MSDEYKKLYSSLTVLGAAIKKVEAHLAKHPFRDDLFIDVSKEFFAFHPEGLPIDEESGFRNEDEIQLLLGMDINDQQRSERGENSLMGATTDALYIHYAEINVPDGITATIDTQFKLSDLPSHEKVAYSKYLPELIRLADTKILELADEAENIAGEIEQALAAAAKKPVREKKTKK